jgi:hypothetical protein
MLVMSSLGAKVMLSLVQSLKKAPTKETVQPARKKLIVDRLQKPNVPVGDDPF